MEQDHGTDSSSQQSAPTDAELDLDNLDEDPPLPEDFQPGFFGRIRNALAGVFKKLLMFIGFLGLGALGIALGWYSFTDIEKMRQLERTPEIPNSAVITGEVNLSGEVKPMHDLLQAPDTGTATVHYRYIVEERVRDSDGNRKWETVHSSRNRVDFILSDPTGAVIIGATDAGVEMDAERKSRRRDGNMRYTEYRIDPGDQIFTFGYAQEAKRGFRVGYREDGQYYPIISAGTEADQRHSRAIASGVMVVLGVGSLLFAVFFLMRLFRIHHSALYLSVATAVVVVTLCFQGYSMVVTDLRSADERAERVLDEGERVIADLLDEKDVDWNGDIDSLGSLDDTRYTDLSDSDRRRLSGVRMLMARSVLRTNDNLSRFPEMIIGPSVGLQPLDPVDIPEDEQGFLEAWEADYSPVRLGIEYGFGAIVIGILGLLFGTSTGLKRITTKRTIENVPTSPTTGAVYGLTELKGRAELTDSQNCFQSPMTSMTCVYYRYKVERKKKSGKNTRWVTLRDDTEVTSFYCRDQFGKMLIEPQNAECSASRRVRRQRGRRRYTEWTIAEDESVYALGSATIDPETHEDLILTDEDEDVPFLVSSHTEGELMQQKAAAGFALLNAGIVATMMAGMGVAGMVVSIGPMLYVTTAAISCGYLFFVLIFLYYNDLVFLRERVDRNWSNIDVALKKRFDLIQKLANIVEEYMGHERRLQETVTRARTAREAADGESPDEAELEAGAQARDKLIATVENHPQIRSQELTQNLMQSLTEVENDIAHMRQGYNDSVERYNTRIHHFPEVFVARAAGFRDARHLQSTRSDVERDPVSVDDLGSGDGPNDSSTEPASRPRSDAAPEPQTPAPAESEEF